MQTTSIFSRFTFLTLVTLLLAAAAPSSAQSFRFSLRAEPEIIPANGVSTTSIIVQVNNTGANGISGTPIVRFVTTRGVIERQAILSNGIGRVLLRSSNQPGTAVVTAVMPGGSTEQIAVEFTDSSVDLARYLEVAGPYVTYGTEKSSIAASGRCTFDLGDTHVESDIRLDVDLNTERLWAEGNTGKIIIRHGRGDKAKVLIGDRLYYDFGKRQGVIRRIDTTLGPARQEFMGSDFRSLPEGTIEEPPLVALAPEKKPVSKKAKATAPDPKAKATAQDQDVFDAITMARVPTTSNVRINGVPVKIEGLLVKEDYGFDGAMAAITPTSSVETRDNAQLLPIAAPAGEIPLAGNGSAQVLPPEAAIAPRDTAPSLAGTIPDGISAAPPGNTKEGEGKDDKVEMVAELPAYQAMNPETTPGQPFRIIEPPPPDVDNTSGFWVVARRLRVFPHDKVQFENASIFFNGRKLYSMPLYVVSLNGAFNPTTDMMALNTEGGLTLNVPYYYIASPNNTGTAYLKHAPGNGFSSDKRGFSLAVEHQYWLNNRSHGDLEVDQLGRGDWNINWKHSHRFSPTMNGAIYVDSPRHRDAYVRGTFDKQFRGFQVGMEGFVSKTEGDPLDGKGQFYARMRPRQLGKTDWVYTLTGNVTAWRRYTEYFEVGGTTSSTGAVGLPGHTRPGTTLYARTGPLYSQTVNAALQSPNFRLWRGANLQANLSATAYNYSNNRRGLSPGITLGLQQRLGRTGNFQIDYSYDRGGLGLFGTGYTNFVSSSLQLNLGRKLSSSTSLTRSFGDDSLYGVTALDYFLSEKWRLGLFSDYSSFGDIDNYLNYGFSVGRQVGQREVTMNWDHERGRVYFQLGNLIY